MTTQAPITVAARLEALLRDGEHALTSELAELGLDYDTVQAVTDYHRAAAAWTHALNRQHFIPPLTDNERNALATFLAGEMQRMINALVDAASERKRKEQAYAASRLSEWGKQRKRIAPDKHVLALLDGPDVPADVDTLEADLLYAEVDANGRIIHRLAYPKPTPEPTTAAERAKARQRDAAQQAEANFERMLDTNYTE